MNDQQQDLIRRACGHISGWQDRWATLVERGATDEEIVERLNKEFGIMYGSSGIGDKPYICVKGKPPRVWWDGEESVNPVTDKPNLKGKPLLAAVRAVFGIGQPGQMSLFNLDGMAEWTQFPKETNAETKA